MKKVLLIATCVIGVSAPIIAQEAIVSRDVAVFAAGVNPNTGAPVEPLTNVPNAQWTCGQARVTPPGTVQNPTTIRIADPANSTLDCVVQAAVATTILDVPVGTGYRVAVRTRGATTAAAWSATGNPFERVAIPPAVATDVRVQ